MKLSAAFGLFGDFYFAIKLALIPTTKAIIANPKLLLQPSAVSRLFFSHVWATFGPETDEGARPVKSGLITPNAHGVVLDIGAGHGHTMKHLDRKRVSKYIALEPNSLMHGAIRQMASQTGYSEADGSLVILSRSAQDSSSILHDLESTPEHPPVDTVVSILTLCSIPSPETTMTRLIKDLVRPGGQLLFYEHVLSPRKDVAWWQRLWSPMWSVAFDGCRLDRPTHVWVQSMKDTDSAGNSLSMWSNVELWGKAGEPDEHLFWHRVGKFVKHL